MSGGDDLNAQGIKKDKKIRSKFPLAWPGYSLGIGDFEGFEITLADAAYGDPGLRADLQSYRDCHKCTGSNPNCKECKGTGKTKTKIHALFGTCVYPNMTYEQILATDGTEDNKYTRCKSAVFALLYGGEGYTLMDRLGVDIDVANEAYNIFCHKYPMVGKVRAAIAERFCSIKQPGGIGSRVEYTKPDDYIDSLFGFRRYFTLENAICKAFFDLAQHPPQDWFYHKNTVLRSDRMQTVVGATQSALYGAAFALQGSIIRAALNHQIQSSGATLTKALQRKLWDLQPSGIHEYIVQPLNVHDEIVCPVKHGYEATVAKVVNDTVESFKEKVPLISMDWKTKAKSWADK
jgi:DNA polymerase I-like protein with 3'-5' exonuclease and polymerase domains